MSSFRDKQTKKEIDDKPASEKSDSGTYADFVQEQVQLSAGGAAQESLIDKLIDGKYRVIEQLGKGGMGAVYRGEHELMNRDVAIKVLHPNLSCNEESLNRFLQEARVASKLSHRNAVTLYDFGVDQGIPYIVMEYVKGTTLKKMISEKGALSSERAYEVISEVGLALAEAHSLGIVHRDLKPDNIMVCEAGSGKEIVKVLDFGIAKVLQGVDESLNAVKTQTGMFFGTPEYMSPEVMGKDLDARSDIYSLGIVLYEMLAGRVPFKADSLMAVLMEHLKTKPEPMRKFRPEANISQAVDTVVMKALEKDPKDRFQTVAEFVSSLKQAVEDGAQGGIFKAIQPTGRKRLLLPAAALMLLAVFLGAYLLPSVLNSAQASGDLQIDSSPSGAEVIVNGVNRGLTPLLLSAMDKGKYKVLVQKKGYSAVSIPVEIANGQKQRINVPLMPDITQPAK